jgi:hypothetical protein
MNHNNTYNTTHQEVSMLLPWHVNKTLQGDEQICVEKHLKNCLLCRRELMTLQKLSASVCQPNETTFVAHTSFFQLKKRIHATEQQSAMPKTGMAGVLSGYRLWFVNLNLMNGGSGYSSIALATILIFSLTLFIPYFLSTKQKLGDEFHTLSSTNVLIAKENEIRVVFSNNITPQQITQILSAVQARIIASPSPRGVYTVRVEKEKITPEGIKETVALLRKNTHVIFAEPSLSLLSQANREPN